MRRASLPVQASQQRQESKPVFVENEDIAVRYRGYNPEFVRRVEARREMERRERLIAEMKAKKQAEKERRANLETALVEDARVARVIAQYREVEILRGKKSVRQIILETAIKHGVTEAEILGPCRTKKYVDARHEAMWRARQERPDLSLPQIGNAFRRDHTSILSAVRKMDKKIEQSGN